MNEKGITNLRSYLQQMDDSALDEMLRAEVEKNSPDAESVRLILRILEERDATAPLYIDEKTAEAWDAFQAQTVKRKKRKMISCLPQWTMKAASIVLACFILFSLIPQDVRAETFLERLASWTDSILELFTRDTVNNNHVEYVFQTDHPGLQVFYDTVVELGITDPVVPMWIPENYEFMECEKIDSPNKTGIIVRFTDQNRVLLFTLDYYYKDEPSEFHKDRTEVQIYEKAGISHAIMRNNEYWIVVWTRGKIECSMNIDCKEDTLYRIVESIYVMEGNK